MYLTIPESTVRTWLLSATEVTVPILKLPAKSRVARGEVVPIPTFPSIIAPLVGA